MEDVDFLLTHYKDTCDIQNKLINVRNKLFVYLCVSISFLFLLMINQNGIIGIIEELAQTKYEISIMLPAEIVMSLIWIVILYLTMRYIRTNIHIERQYSYINQLEKQLTKVSNQMIAREGNAYADNYPFVLNYIDFLYKWVIPILFSLVVIIKIVLEIYNGITGNIVFDIIVAIADVVLWIGYILFLHPIKREKH